MLFVVFGLDLLLLPGCLLLKLVLAVERRVDLNLWLVLKQHSIVEFLLVDAASVELWVVRAGAALVHLLSFLQLGGQNLGLLLDFVIPPVMVLLVGVLDQHAVVLILILQLVSVVVHVVRVLSSL